jgi:hypothetical protein
MKSYNLSTLIHGRPVLSQETTMDDIQAVLKQKLVEQTQQLVARGGPSALTTAGRFLLHYEPDESFFYAELMESPPKSETY